MKTFSKIIESLGNTRKDESLKRVFCNKHFIYTPLLIHVVKRFVWLSEIPKFLQKKHVTIAYYSIRLSLVLTFESVVNFKWFFYYFRIDLSTSSSGLFA